VRTGEQFHYRIASIVEWKTAGGHAGLLSEFVPSESIQRRPLPGSGRGLQSGVYREETPPGSGGGGWPSGSADGGRRSAQNPLCMRSRYASFAFLAKGRATHCVGDASEIKSLGHPAECL
jgi:hypothetical protein